MNEIIQINNITENTKRFEIYIESIDTALLSQLETIQEDKNVTLRFVPTLDVFESLMNILSAPFTLTIENPLLISEQLLSDYHQLLAKSFAINYVTMDAEQIVYHISTGQVDEDSNLGKIERAMIIQQDLAADEKAELKRIATLERDYKNNRASFLKHKRLYQDTLAALQAEQQRNSSIKQVIDEKDIQINKLTEEVNNIRKQYEDLSQSRLGRLQLKLLARKKRD